MLPILINNYILANGNEQRRYMEPIIKETTVESIITKSNLCVIIPLIRM